MPAVLRDWGLGSALRNSRNNAVSLHAVPTGGLLQPVLLCCCPSSPVQSVLHRQADMQQEDAAVSFIKTHWTG